MSALSLLRADLKSIIYREVYGGLGIAYCSKWNIFFYARKIKNVLHDEKVLRATFLLERYRRRKWMKGVLGGYLVIIRGERERRNMAGSRLVLEGGRRR